MTGMETIGIPLAFLVFCGITLWILIWAKGHWLFKMGFIAATMYFGACMYKSLDALEGWPTQEELPDKFEVFWIKVEEPNKRTKDPGTVYVWAQDLEPEKKKDNLPYFLKFHTKDEDGESRVHILPYSDQLRDEAQKIMERLKKGGRFMASKGKGKGIGKGKGEGKGKGKGRGNGRRGKGDGKGKGGSLSQQQEPIFHELPPPKYPDKNPC